MSEIGPAPRRASARKNKRIREEEAELVVDKLGGMQGYSPSPALEVGCGDGVQSSILTKLGELVSVDIDRTLRSRPFTFVLASFEYLPFRESSFRWSTLPMCLSTSTTGISP